MEQVRKLHSSNNTGIEHPAPPRQVKIHLLVTLEQMVNNQINNAVSVQRALDGIIATEHKALIFSQFVAANPGGTFTISGSDAALFNVNTTTGEIKSKASLDFENPDDDGADNVL